LSCHLFAEFCGIDKSDARQLKGLEVVNSKLKKLLAEAMLDIEALKGVVKESTYRAGETGRSCGDAGVHADLRAPRLPACRGNSHSLSRSAKGG
jgi:putative transposase